MRGEMQLNNIPLTAGGADTISSNNKQKGKGKKKRSRRFYICLSAFVLLSMVGSVFASIGYKMYNAIYPKDLSLAQAGMQHLRTSEALLKALPETPFNAQRVGQAQREFSDALIAFSQVNGDLQS